MTRSLQRATNAQQLFFCRRGTRDQLSLDRFVQDRARGGKADRASAKTFLHNGRHPRNLSLCWLLVCRTAITHYVGTHRSVGDLSGNIHCAI